MKIEIDELIKDIETKIIMLELDIEKYKNKWKILNKVKNYLVDKEGK